MTSPNSGLSVEINAVASFVSSERKGIESVYDFDFRLGIQIQNQFWKLEMDFRILFITYQNGKWSEQKLGTILENKCLQNWSNEKVIECFLLTLTLQNSNFKWGLESDCGLSKKFFIPYPWEVLVIAMK